MTTTTSQEIITDEHGTYIRKEKVTTNGHTTHTEGSSLYVPHTFKLISACMEMAYYYKLQTGINKIKTSLEEDNLLEEKSTALSEKKLSLLEKISESTLDGISSIIANTNIKTIEELKQYCAGEQAEINAE